MRNLNQLFLFVSLFCMIACGSSNDLTEDVVGSYIGTYEEATGFGSLSVEDADLNISRTNDETVSFSMPDLAGLNISFEGTMINMSEISITNATVGALVLSGTAKLEGDNIKIAFVDADNREVASYRGIRK